MPFLPFRPILDRILLKLVHEDSPKDGFEVPEKFRQHTNKGEVLAIGDCVVLSGQKFPITDFVNVGDHVLFGEYCAERFASEELSKQFGTEELYIVRIQDVRGTARKKVEMVDTVGGVPVENVIIDSGLIDAARAVRKASRKLGENLQNSDILRTETWPATEGENV